MTLPTSILEFKQCVARKEASYTELIQEYVRNIQTCNKTYNAIITDTSAQALAQAQALDKHPKEDSRPLRGVPIVHKDIFCTEGVRTSCASKMLDSFIAPYSATMVQRLERAGCLMLGKSNMDEFAMGSSTEHSYYQSAHNPWDTQRVTGGSSGGSAAAVAAHFCLAATGSDTGGSIRQPATFCGVTGLKPTYGRISRWGMIAYASSLDTGGFFAHSAKDIAHLLAAVAGIDELDSTCSRHGIGDYIQQASAPQIIVRKVGIPRDILRDVSLSVASGIEEVIKILESAGIGVVNITLQNLEHMIATYYIIACAEASSNLSRYDGIRFGHRSANGSTLQDLYCNSRAEGFGYEVKKRILLGTYVLSAAQYDAYYLRALRLRRIIQSSLCQTLSEVDAILMPVAPSVAFMQGSKSSNAMYLEDVFTVPSNLAGVPAISFPTGFDGILPVGAQFIGRHFAEGPLLQLVETIQKQTDWHRKKPTLTT